jgi:hypothetical protein
MGLLDKGFTAGDSMNLWVISVCLLMLALDFTCGSVALERAARVAADRPVECECRCGP